jgi:hypothetical protein
MEERGAWRVQMAAVSVGLDVGPIPMQPTSRVCLDPHLRPQATYLNYKAWMLNGLWYEYLRMLNN